MSPKSNSARIAGENGWIPISGAAFLHPRYTSGHWETYAEGCESVGRRADPNIWRVSRSIVVAPSDEEALDYVLNPDGPMSYWYRYFLSSIKARKLTKYVAPESHPDPDNITWQEIAKEQCTFGSPETVLDKLVALRDLTGHFGVLTAMAHEWDNKAFCKRSLTMLAEEVMPRFSQHAETDSQLRAAE